MKAKLVKAKLVKAKLVKAKQEKEPGTRLPRLSHFCPQCGQFPAFRSGDNPAGGKRCWTL